MDKDQIRRPEGSKKSLDALDKVLAGLPEEQYDHTKREAPAQMSETKQPQSTQNQAAQKPAQNQNQTAQKPAQSQNRTAQKPAQSQNQAAQKPAQNGQNTQGQGAQHRRGRRPKAADPAAAKQTDAAARQGEKKPENAAQTAQKQQAQNQPKPAQSAQKQAQNAPRQAQKQPRQPAAGQRRGRQPQGGNQPRQSAPAQKPVQKLITQAVQPELALYGKLPPVPAPTPDIAEQAGQKRRGRPPRSSKTPPLKIIPLGGLGEIGKNMTAYEYGDDIIIVDCGLAFPDEEMLGVDIVIPDFTYLEENRDKLRGLVVTHGHEDHIGAIPYLLQSLNIPVYASRFTIALIEGKLREQGILNRASLTIVNPRQSVTLGCMNVEFITVNHSIPDACALAIRTPAGVVIQTGDFKVDYTPAKGDIIDLARFGELGSQGVLALLADSTNAERPGSTPSERIVGDSFELLFKNAVGKRIIVATFSSNVYRVQQVIDTAVRFGRKVAMVGRSMENVMAKALELGYLDAPEGTVLTMDALNRLPDREAVIVTTGSQGEALSGLTRMAMGDHRKVSISQNDLIIVSAYPIPGNEKFVDRVVNELMRLGAEVVYEKYSDIHVSGHACQDEQKLMLALTKPKYFIPVHGEYKHLKKHAGLALRMGMAPENVMIPELGRVIEVSESGISATTSVTAGAVMVDGLGVGDVGSVVLRDRKHLGEDGLIIVVVTLDGSTGAVLSGPDIVSRGFVYVREAEDMIGETRNVVRRVLSESSGGQSHDWANLKLKIRDAASDYLYSVTKRSPMILPVIQEVKPEKK